MSGVVRRRHCRRRRTLSLRMAVLLGVGAACDPRVEIRVVTPLDVPTQADMMVVTASAAEARTVRFGLDGSGPSDLHFELSFESSPPSRLPLKIDLQRDGEVTGRANVVLEDLESDACFVVFVPPFASTITAFVSPCRGSRPDAAISDAGMSDAGRPDTGSPMFDGGGRDAATPDSGEPDAGLSDGGAPDAQVPDSGIPDSGIPDAAISIGYEPSNVRLQGLLWAPSLLLPDGECILDTDTPRWSGLGCASTPPIIIRTQRHGRGPEVAVVAVQSLTIQTTATLSVRGRRPAVLIVERDAQIAGTIRAFKPTFGSAPEPLCDSEQWAGGRGLGPLRSGGGGGGLGSAGGRGGGDGPAGRAVAMPTPEPLLTGCRGGSGYEPSDVCQRVTSFPCLTEGGQGGGGVQLSCGGNVTFAPDSVVVANGGAGEGGVHGENILSGGSGGGSGGMILVEADQISAATGAKILAIGGGGGGAAGTDAAGLPGNESDNSGLSPLGGAAGVGQGVSGAGGRGSRASAPAEDGADGSGDTDTFGGGGGGGGSGLILFRTLRECRIETETIFPDLTDRRGCL
ncbi:MAG: hypothetical protein AAF449_14515 [Myxococcota bacterium]